MWKLLAYCGVITGDIAYDLLMSPAKDPVRLQAWTELPMMP